MPWEEPHWWFMDNVGPLGGHQEKREAMELATKLLEGGIPEIPWDFSSLGRLPSPRGSVGFPGGIFQVGSSRWDFPGGIFQVGFSRWDLPGGIFWVGSSWWDLSGGIIQVGSSRWDLPGGIFRVGSSRWDHPGGIVQVGPSRWDRPGGIFQVGSSRWDLPGGIFQVGSSRWDLPGVASLELAHSQGYSRCVGGGIHKFLGIFLLGKTPPSPVDPWDFQVGSSRWDLPGVTNPELAHSKRYSRCVFPSSWKHLSSQELCFPGIPTIWDRAPTSFSRFPGIQPGKAEQEGRRSKRKGARSAEGGKENQERIEERITSRPGIPRKTLRRILEVVSDESAFLLENKLLKPLREVVGPRNDVRQLRSIFEALRIEDEDELRDLMDFFLDYESHNAPKIPVSQGEDPTAEDQGKSGSHSQRDQSQPLGSAPRIPAIQADHVLTILREFLQEFGKLRDEGPPKEIQHVRDNSKDGEYWEALTRIIPQRKLKLWDALGAALVEYHKVLTRRSELFSEATALQQQNSELGMLLEEYLASTQGP
uniref:Dynein regulatory complex protein 1 C-terminal domain-containing protein n=1 Tax=Serinus canaria TaxID=9135 RepID=A0A8C9NRW8_SERCA